MIFRLGRGGGGVLASAPGQGQLPGEEEMIGEQSWVEDLCSSKLQEVWCSTKW